VTQAILRLRAMWWGVPPEDDEEGPEIPDRDDPLVDMDNVVVLADRGAIYG